MRLVSLGFKGFRNLEDSLISTDAGKVILIGQNGQGKTNFLEAIYTMCYGGSFRTDAMCDLVKTGGMNFTVKGTAVDDDNRRHVIEFSYENGKRCIKTDGNEIKDRKELIYNIPCIVFSHEDMSFVSGEPENRRRFFDQTMSMYSPEFFDTLRHYRAVLRQRNTSIKMGESKLAMLYDSRLASFGWQIRENRKKAVGEFNELFPGFYRAVSGEDRELNVKYKPSWNNQSSPEDIEYYLAATIDRDLKQGATASGPHRDQFVVCDGETPFASVGSTGQLRLASLLFRIAQVEFFRAKTGKNPLILVDDVLLELDRDRRAKFLEKIDHFSQAFFTFLPRESYFRKLSGEDTLIYKVEEGRFRSYGQKQ